jgi:tetratricopeptide (TPR) repeat protein
VVACGTIVLVLLFGRVLYRWEGQKEGEKLSQAVKLTAEGRDLAGARRLHEAIDKYNLAIKLKPDYPETYINLGKAMQEKGDIDKAIEAYNRALALVRNDSAVYASRGQLYATKGDFQNALADYNAAINLEPDNPNLYFARSRVYQGLKQEDLAAKDLEKAKTLK